MQISGKGGQLKKLVIVLALGFMMVPRAFSFSIITDSDLFYSFFEKPLTIIEFTELKDGTSYDYVQNGSIANRWIISEPECLMSGKGDIHLADRDGRILVRPNAFSDNWSFRVYNISGQESFCEAITWFNQGISSGKLKMTVAAPAGRAAPFVLYTNKGFMGVVPDNPRESVFIFDNFSVVFSFETEFLRTPTTLNSKDAFFAGIKLY